MRLVEIHEQPWFPGFLRDDVLEALQFVFKIGDVYGSTVSQLKRAFRACGTTQVLDLCSGGCGPWLSLHREFTSRDCPVQIFLSDKYPGRKAFEESTDSREENLHYLPRPVDARQIPADLAGFRTMFSSFHHFQSDEAVGILRDAVIRDEGIGIFDAASRHPSTIVSTILMLLGGFVTAPFIRPFRVSRLFWTYVLPVVPLVLFIDGLVSCLRAYSPEQLSQMTASLHADSYRWEIGRCRSRICGVTYLLGYPRRTCKSNT